MKMRYVLLTLVSCSLFIFVAACQKQPETKPIRIGAILPLTGDGALYGQQTRAGMDFALDEINGGGGIKGRKVQIIYEDDQLEPKNGVNALQKLAQIDRVPIVIGPVSSGVTLAVAPIANERRVVILSPYASNYKITEAGDYIFRIYPSDAFQGIKDAEVTWDIRCRSAAIFHVNSDYGIGLRNIFKQKYMELRGTIAVEESFEAGAADFRAQLTKIKAAKPDCIFMPGNEKEMGKILIQARELRLDQQFIATDSFLAESIIKEAGKAAEGVIFTTLGDNRDGVYQKFATAFEKATGKNRDYWSL